ncbi:nucleoside diphosphate-linked moiety X motif 17 isoform X1 [Ciconia boyciana]|uniref:nucleoside diphosphate-linked moiety X motif 17 isoform X1 n=1 Tax=Ciconia boyciana TaxID=52775 RepID=UPI003BA2F591
MAGLARVVVHVRRGGAGGPARFGQSVTGTFCPAHEDAAVVSCGLDGGRFLLSDMPFPGSTVALLKRPSFCPAKRLGEQPELALPAELRGRGVAAGVAVLLQASTGRVLLTRRAGTLSIFPNVWVPPAAGRGAAGAGGGDGAAPGSGDLLLEDARPLGGNVRLGWGGSAPPPLPDGAGHPWVRGAAPGRCLPPPTDTAAPARGAGGWPWGPLPSSSVSPQSVYPPMLSRGLPRRHHIVTYLLLLSAESHEQLEARMRPSESEVSAYAWLEPPVLEAIAATEDGAESLGNVPSALPATVGITELSTGSSSTVQLPTATFLNTAPAEGEDVERVSTGTKFALRLWLESLGEQGRAWP